MTEIGQALRTARERRELTQTQVMALTGINNKTLSGYENGVAEPDLQTLSILLRLYQVSADQLLRLDSPIQPADEIRLLELYRDLSPERQEELPPQIPLWECCELLLLLETLLRHRSTRKRKRQERG